MEKYAATLLPVLIALIIVEWKWGKEKRKQWSRKLYWNNFKIGVLAQIAQMSYKPLFFVAYHYCEINYGFYDFSSTSVISYVLALILADFAFYWWHRASHTFPFLWGGHSVHHTGCEYNYGVTFRMSIIAPIFMLSFLFPICFLGIPSLPFGVALIFTSVYQGWLHTEMIKKIPFMEPFFITPSSHRVHHATNPEYLNKNFGATFNIWDRLFGTFLEENDTITPQYKTKVDRSMSNPLRANFDFYIDYYWTRFLGKREKLNLDLKE